MVNVFLSSVSNAASCFTISNKTPTPQRESEQLMTTLSIEDLDEGKAETKTERVSEQISGRN